MISEEKPDSHKKRISIIADTLKEHPEYILYVLSQDEYEDVNEMAQVSNGRKNRNIR